MKTPPDGSSFAILESHNQRLAVNPRGGGIASYARLEAGGLRDIFHGYADDAGYEGAMGDILSPFPNRLRHARYDDGGFTREVTGFARRDGHSTHAFVREVPWKLSMEENSIVARLSFPETQYAPNGYPFALSYEVRYTLEPSGLRVTTEVANNGSRKAPFGLAFHPYFALKGPMEEVQLSFKAGELHRFNETLDGLRPALRPSDERLDFSSPMPIGDKAVNGCYGRLGRDPDGLMWVRVAEPKFGREVRLFQDASFPFIQVYTGEVLTRKPRGALAVEPSTVTAFAFNGDGFGARWLEPGETFRGLWGVAIP